MALTTAACFAAAYAVFTLYDNGGGALNRTAAEVVSAVGEPVAFGLALLPPAATCGIVFAFRRRPLEEAARFAALTALMTAIGWVVGFAFLFFIGGAA